MSLHLIQHPKHPLFISFQCPSCKTWNCFNFAYFTVLFTSMQSNPSHMCRKCSTYHEFDKYTAADIILKKHNIVLDKKSVNYDIDSIDKLKELIQFYKILGSADERPNVKNFSYNPFDDMFKD